MGCKRLHGQSMRLRTEQMRRRFATIHDVAADARVSIATVSRVLNEPWRVTDQTLERVSTSIRKLGYEPNLRARLLARGNAGTMCFLLSNRPFVHLLHAEILQGAASKADKMGVQMVYATCNYCRDAAPADIQMPRVLGARALIDGVILAGTNYTNIMSALDELRLPYVVFGTNLVTDEPEMPRRAVYVDDEGGGYQATEHLLSLGHTRITFVGDVSLPWYRRRHEGYVRAMEQAGLEPDEPTGRASDGELAMGFNAVNDMCDRGGEFTALFVGGDMGALGALRALRTRGIDVPGDVSVVGFNDEELAQIAEPPLTTIRVPKEEIGARCVEMLEGIIKDSSDATDKVVMDVKLVERESVGVCGGGLRAIRK